MCTMKSHLAAIALLGIALAVVAVGTSQAARRVLLVGVGQYQDSKYNLPGVPDDVRLLKQVLTEKCGFRESEIRTLVDSEATKQNIMKNFEEWLIQGTAPGDLAFFYFSGHGIRVWDQTGRKIEDGQEEAIMPHDARVLKGKTRRIFKHRPGLAYDVRDTVNAIRGEEIRNSLAHLRDRIVVFISDSCHSGTVYKALNSRAVFTKNFEIPTLSKGIMSDRRSQLVEKGLGQNRISFGPDLADSGGKIAAFTACENSQTAQIVSFDKPPTGPHSVFTWFLYQALLGKADYDNNRKITFNELATFLRDEIKRSGFEQMPQHEFRPGDLGKTFFSIRGRESETRVERLSSISCFLEPSGNISASESQKTQTFVSMHLPEIRWVKEKARASVLVLLEKRGGSYRAQISDPSGAIWECQRGSTLREAEDGLLRNLKAYYVQSTLLALQNMRARSDFNFSHEVKSATPRASGEVVKGDAIVLRIKASSPGYVYVFSVDTVGTIHPLYPMPDAKPQELQSGRTIDLGADGSFTVQEPFGRDVIFAFFLKDAPQSLTPFWNRNDIGDPKDPGIADQRRFMETIWKELMASGTPKGEWKSGVLVLRSFAR